MFFRYTFVIFFYKVSFIINKEGSMALQFNELKAASILEEERSFFLKYKKTFIQTFKYVYKQHYNCKHCVLDIDSIASNFYDGLFDNNTDTFEKHLCCIFRMKLNGKDAGFLYNELLIELIENFTNQNLDSSIVVTRVKSILSICKKQQNLLQKILDSQESFLENKTFDMAKNIAMQDRVIPYFKNLANLGRNLKLFIHTEIGSAINYVRIEQIGNNSVVVKVSDEQLTALKLSNNSFLFKNLDDEKNFSVKADILCSKESTVILKNIKELNAIPLLSRRYPRASIIYTSVVHLANENEYIVGNMIDISEGGIGVMSDTKSTFEKGQDVVAFVSYEDPKKELKFNFEATGYIASIIGEKSAFRYGVSLNLSEKERELIQSIVNS